MTLPIGSRLTPLARDWLREKRVAVAYGTSAATTQAAKPAAVAGSRAPRGAGNVPGTTDAVVWWCDGPCGHAKAAVAAQARQTRLEALTVTADAKYLVAAITALAKAVREGRAAGGVLLVQSGAAAVVYANRCKSLRAILGTCRQSVEQGVLRVAANVLIVEHPYQTLPQVRNMLSLFVRGIAIRGMTDEVKQRLDLLASCE